MKIELPDVIETPRLFIRPFTLDDLDAYLEFMTNPEATRYLLLTSEQQTEAGARELLDMIMQSYQGVEPIVALCIELKETGSFIGSCGVAPIEGEDRICECYYSLLPGCWGNGYATEATDALLEWVFRSTPAIEVRAYMSPENDRSLRLAQRLKMCDRGTARHPTLDVEGRMFSIGAEAYRQDAG